MTKKIPLIGAIPDHMLTKMIHDEQIVGALPKHVNPASLNLPISEEVWRVEKFYLPQAGEEISEMIRTKFEGRPHGYTHPLERGVQYLVKLKPTIDTDNNIYGFCNPRSTTGRTFLNARVVCDGVPRYDTIPKGFKGEMWMLVKNDIFSCLLLEDDELVQMRLFYSDTRLSQKEMRTLYSASPLLFKHNGDSIGLDALATSDNDGSLIMTLSIRVGQFGWKTRFTNKPVKFSKLNFAGDFFEEAYSSDQTFDLDSRTGLIAPTKELIWVPSNMAAEGVRVDDRSGEFESHRAGYIDAGFKGAITLEITGSGETIRDGTSAIKVRYERTMSPAEKPYTAGYSGQVEALLGKNFYSLIQSGGMKKVVQKRIVKE